MIFVDTGVWFAKFVTDDINHARVEFWFQSTDNILITTDFCVDETLTLLGAAAGWSFTDGTSKVVIDDLGIHTAAALDDHFRQFGIDVVP